MYEHDYDECANEEQFTEETPVSYTHLDVYKRQALHSACQFRSSQNSFSSPRCGTMWSTTVAGAILPRLRHSTHSGFRRRNRSRAVRHS